MGYGYTSAHKVRPSPSVRLFINSCAEFWRWHTQRPSPVVLLLMAAEKLVLQQQQRGLLVSMETTTNFETTTPDNLRHQQPAFMSRSLLQQQGHTYTYHEPHRTSIREHYLSHPTTVLLPSIAITFDGDLR